MWLGTPLVIGDPHTLVIHQSMDTTAIMVQILPSSVRLQIFSLAVRGIRQLLQNLIHSLFTNSHGHEDPEDPGLEQCFLTYNVRDLRSVFRFKNTWQKQIDISWPPCWACQIIRSKCGFKTGEWNGGKRPENLLQVQTMSHTISMKKKVSKAFHNFKTYFIQTPCTTQDSWISSADGGWLLFPKLRNSKR